MLSIGSVSIIVMFVPCTGIKDMLCCSWSKGPVWDARVHRRGLSEGNWAHRAGKM